MINVLLNFTNMAGKKLKRHKKHIDILGNKDSSIESVVTKADISISNFFSKTIKKNFSHLNYMVIDEERILKEKNIFEKINQTEYQFVIDPIDGTLQYANNHPLYGISIGVYKNTQPFLGIIYLPELNELTYFDGKQAFWVQNAFKKNAKKTEIFPKKHSSFPIIFGHPWFWKPTSKFSTKKAIFLDYFSAVSQSFYTIIGKSKAYCMNLKLWDIAGTIPITNYLGMKIYEYGSLKIYDRISEEYFDNNMNTKQDCILCYPDDLKEICSLIEPIR